MFRGLECHRGYPNTGLIEFISSAAQLTEYHQRDTKELNRTERGFKENPVNQFVNSSPSSIWSET
jgi:hypothetical protein